MTNSRCLDPQTWQHVMGPGAKSCSGRRVDELISISLLLLYPKRAVIYRYPAPIVISGGWIQHAPSSGNYACLRAPPHAGTADWQDRRRSGDDSGSLQICFPAVLPPQDG